MKQDRGSPYGKDSTDPSLEDDQDSAGDALIEFLNEMHASMPDVPEVEAQKDIEKAIAAVRSQSES